MEKIKASILGLTVFTAVELLTACAPEVDDLTNSRLSQPPAGAPPMVAIDGGDIAIAGQMAAHSIMDLPQVAGATVPPLVQFTGVTSIVTSPTPINTEPYTTLLRDRLLLIAREKLRFVERTLPPLNASPSRKKHKQEASAPADDSNPDYQILAELHGRYENDYYNVQIEFVDAHSGDVLFNQLYRIAKEADTTPSQPSVDQIPPSPPTPPPGDATMPPPPPDHTQLPPAGSPQN